MKAFGKIFFIIVLFALGYAIYPSLSEHFGWGGKTASSTSDGIADPADSEDYRGRRSGYYTIEVRNQREELIALFRGRSASNGKPVIAG